MSKLLHNALKSENFDKSTIVSEDVTTDTVTPAFVELLCLTVRAYMDYEEMAHILLLDKYTEEDYSKLLDAKDRYIAYFEMLDSKEVSDFPKDALRVVKMYN